MTALVLILALVAMNAAVVAVQIWSRRRRARGEEGDARAPDAGWLHRT